MKSILQENKECFVCKKTQNLHLHHIFFGKNRKISDKNGFVCYLCYEHHEGQTGVHNKNGNCLDDYLKKTCQERFERLHSREEFRKLIGKSYL